ncbi:MAG: MMPL family transporter, partial [Candidatus Hadarchaeia archaeon]
IALPFQLTGEGPERWKEYSAGNAGKPAVIYLDRPGETGLLIPEHTIQALESQQFQYSEDRNRLVFRNTEEDLGENESISFEIQIPVGRINTQSEPKIPESTRNLLENRRGLLTKVIWMGEEDEFPSEFSERENLTLDNLTYPIQYNSQQDEEAVIDWLQRITGLRSWPVINSDVENQAMEEMSITGLDSREEARELRRVLSQGLPVEIEIISEEPMGRQLSEDFVREAAIAGAVAFLIVAILVYSFYKRLKIVLPLLLTMASEVIITFGVASALPSGIMSIELHGIAGLIAVVGTGVDHQIIITDEILGEKFSESERLPIDRRTGKAFSIIFAAAATTIAAMIALALFGFGAMRGFALITLFGVLVSILITRPAYAKIVGTLLEREAKNK